MSELTPWYPPEVRPVRPGWYACQQCTISHSWRNRHYWNGKRWLHNGPDGEPVKIEFGWRGLTKPTDSEGRG